MVSLPPARPVPARPFVAILALAPAVPPGLVHAAPPPAVAIDAIAKVRLATDRKDYAALRASMVEDFRWSFGGDASTNQAVAEWNKQPRYLQQLVCATAARCVLEPDGYVECRAGAKTSFRAGFTLRDGHWKFAYFVEGD